jgi:hypothetical protein
VAAAIAAAASSEAKEPVPSIGTIELKAGCLFMRNEKIAMGIAVGIAIGSAWKAWDQRD